MIRKLQAIPIYLLLVPLFFILHNIQENYDLINLQIAGKLFLIYCLTTAGSYAIAYLLVKDHRKSSIITILWMSLFLFYSAFHELLKTYSPWSLLGRYVFALPFAIVVFVLIFTYVTRTNKKFEGLYLLLNLLFAIYILLDLLILGWKASAPEKYNLSMYDFPEYAAAQPCDTCAKPDIYFLLFDEYAGTQSLKAKYDFDNKLDDYLVEKGFNIQPASRSNYNFTVFSLSSILNMSYIRNFHNPKAATANDYVSCKDLIRDNRVTAFLERSGYDILNFSTFDLKGKPALTEQYFLIETRKIITGKTFFNRIFADIGWHFSSRLKLLSDPKKSFLKQINTNQYFLARVKETAAEKSNRPRFIYTHIMLPHGPFFFDRNGNKRDEKVVFKKQDYHTPSSYLQHVEYTNKFVKNVVDTILGNNPNAVVILMGDHGYRPENPGPHPVHYFNNLNAVYYPDKDYKELYSDISGCNQFRVILNKLFNQKFPLLQDSTIYVVDRKIH